MFSFSNQLMANTHLPSFTLVLLSAQYPHFICKFIWLGTAWPSLQSGPTESPEPGPLFRVPGGKPPYPAYLLHFIWAAMATICEAVGKQMLFFHLWNQVFGKQSAFWWPESSKSASVKGRGRSGGSRLHHTVLYCALMLQGLERKFDHHCMDMLISQSSGTVLVQWLALYLHLHEPLKYIEYNDTHTVLMWTCL